MPVFRIRQPLVLAAVCAGWCLSTAAGQVATPLANQVAPDTQTQSTQSQTDPARPQRPLTPEEQRQKEIDKYNPLKRPTTTDSAQSADSGASTIPEGAAAASQKDIGREAPLPGSVAESNEALPARPGAEGPQVADDSNSAYVVQTYNGPAVLSRTYTLERPLSSKELKWSWTIGSAEVYQNGLVNGVGTTGAAATNGSAFGTTTSFAINGKHFWKRDQVGLDYGLNYTDYFGANAYNGVNQRLSVNYGHEFSRHLTLNLVETGSILSNNYTLENPLTAPGVSVANMSLAVSPTAQLLDQQVRQFQTQATVTWQKTSRLSFSMTGGFFAVDFTGAQALSNAQLTSNVGYQAQADVNYRYTSRMTVGAYYSFTDYTYTKHEDVSDTHTVGLIYSYAFNRRTQLRIRAGVSRLESLAYTQVPINPVFAALIGENSGIIDYYHRAMTSDLSGQFVRDFGRRRTMNISYAHGIAPGNGLILTSTQQIVSAGFTTELFRRYMVNLTAGRSTLSAQVQNTGAYTTNFAGLTVSRTLPRNVTATLGVDYRQYIITNMPGLQSQLRISSGVTWGPGPGKLW